ncbi:hypothetical protein CYJ36_00060 [Bacillus sp. UMB0893]|nr:hypothetical protein CYJ36_00060 [Bacillus sp. UMB0893]
MGVFFEKRESPSTKPFITIRYLILILMVFILIIGLTKGFNFYYLKFLFLASGIGSILDGIESVIKRENKRRILLDFALGFIWLLTFLLFLGYNSFIFSGLRFFNQNPINPLEIVVDKNTG